MTNYLTPRIETTINSNISEQSVKRVIGDIRRNYHSISYDPKEYKQGKNVLQ